MDKATIKGLTNSQIEELSNIQLYNILFGIGMDYKKKYESISIEEKKQTVFLLLGCDIGSSNRLISRMNILAKELLKYEPKKIIFSGGIASKFRISPNNSCAENDKIMKNIKERGERIETFLNSPGDVKKKEEYNINLPSIRSYIKNKMELSDKFEKLPDKQKEKMIDDILDTIKESVIMQYLAEEVYDFNLENIFLETEAINTPDNIKKSFELIKRICDEQIRNVVIITDWKHVSRAMLTAKKISEEQEEHIELFSIIANIDDFNSIEEFREYAISEIKKMKDYSDVGDGDITKYISQKTIVPGGPIISILNEKEINE